MKTPKDAGFTLVEVLVTMTLLSIVSVGLYSVLLAGTDSSNDARAVTQQSEEARLAFNRMVRDTREADRIITATATSFTVHVDFNADGIITAAPAANSSGDYEDQTFTFDEAAGTITLNGAVLIRGVAKVSPSNDVFSYSSNRLQYDSSGDGIVTLAELQTAQNNGAQLSSPLTAHLTNVSFSFDIENGDQRTSFYSQAELRNRR
jgi:prepilin-type N-terminal cleavage/methylation domain-containing protein